MMLLRFTAGLLVLMLCSGVAAGPPVAVRVVEKKGWFGIGLEAATPVEQQAIGIQRPIPKIIHVFPGSPAENSGVKLGEFVARFDGKDVAGVQDLVQRVGKKPPGSQIDVVLRSHSGSDRTVKVVLDLRPDMRGLARKEWIGKPFPTITVKRVGGDDIALGTTDKHVYIVDYFATWCGPCRRVFPELERLQHMYRDKGLRVVAVSDENEKVLSEFLKEYPLKYPVATDVHGAFRKALWVSVLPTLWIVNKDGSIREVLFGAGHGPALEKHVREALGLVDPATLPESVSPVKPTRVEPAKKVPSVK